MVGRRRRQREETAQPEAEPVGAYQAEAAALQQRQEEAAHPEAEAAVLQPSRRWPYKKVRLVNAYGLPTLGTAPSAQPDREASKWTTLTLRLLALAVDRWMVAWYCHLMQFVRTSSFRELLPDKRWRRQCQREALERQLQISGDYANLNSAPGWWKHLKKLGSMRPFAPSEY